MQEMCWVNGTSSPNIIIIPVVNERNEIKISPFKKLLTALNRIQRPLF